MCGLWGSVRLNNRYFNTTKVPISASFKKFAESAALVGTVRGRDSTGIGLVGQLGYLASVYKVAAPGGMFVNIKEAKEMLDLAGESLAVLGHNRAATVGFIDREAAHPFQHENITLTHNGTVHSYEKDLKDFIPKNYDPVSDSDAICYAIAHHGWEKVLPALAGDYALVWWDAGEDKIYMARNNSRPLHLTFAKGGDEMYYTSEEGMLRWLCERDHIITRATPIYEVAPGTVYCFDMKSKNLKDSLTKTPFVVARQYYPVANTNWNHWNNRDNDYTPINRRATRTTKRLEDLGCKLGEVLGFLPEKIQHSKPTSRHGTVQGTLCKLAPGADLETETGYIYGVDGETWLNWKAEGWLEVQARGCLKDGSGIICTFFKFTEAAQEPETKEKKLKSHGVYKNGKGEAVSKQEFIKLVSQGCCACHSRLTEKDADTIEWVGKERNFPLCLHCQEQPWLNNLS